MKLMPPPLPEKLKKAAEAAFRDNAKLALMSPEEREEAAQFYEQVAGDTRRVYADLARLYNLERARFLRGQVARIAPDAHSFRREIGYLERGGRN